MNVTGLGTQNKVYDATTAATLTGAAAISALGADSLSLAGAATGTFADRHVGSNKAVAVTGLTLNGADAGNYSLQLPTSLTADISAAPLQVTGLAAQNRVYDATTVATLTGAAAVSALAADIVALSDSATGAFADKHVGNNKVVAASGLTLNGVDAGNYSLQLPTGLTADITAVPEPVATKFPSAPPPPVVMEKKEVIEETKPGGGLDVSGFVGTPADGVAVTLMDRPGANLGGQDAYVIAADTGRQINELRFPLPDRLRAVLEQSGPAKVTVTLVDHSPLPGWLRFDWLNKMFVAIAAPRNALPVDVLITLGTRTTVVKMLGPERPEPVALLR